MLVLGVLLASPSHAGAPWILRFERLGLEQGLTPGIATAITEDRRGFIWIATTEGLNRYDGFEIVRYRHDPDDPRSLPANDVRALLESRTGADGGTLWIGTRGGGLARWNPETDDFERFAARSEDPAESPENGPLDIEPSLWVRSLYEDRAGTLWLGGRNHGLCRFDPATASCRTWWYDPEDAGALRRPGVYLIFEDSRGVLWIGTRGGGLHHFDRAAGRFTRYPIADGGAPGFQVYAAAEDGDGQLWFGSERGLTRLDPASGSFAAVSLTGPGSDDVGQPSVRALRFDDRGRLWMATDRGLARLDPATGTLRIAGHQPLDVHSLSSDSAQVLYFDRSGALWVGTSAGFDRHDLGTGRFRVERHSPGRLPADDLWQVAEDAAGRVLIAGTGGLARWHLGTDRWDHWTAGAGGLGDETIYTVIEHAGALWAGGPRSLSRIDPVSGRVDVYRPDPEDPASLAAAPVYDTMAARDGSLWLATNRGVDVFDPVSGGFLHPCEIPGDPDGGMLASTFSLAESADGTIWMGTFLNGLYAFAREARTWSRFRPDAADPGTLQSLRINALLVDRDDRLWVGTEAGLSRLEDRAAGGRRGGRFRHWRARQGAPDDSVVAITQDAAGAIWFGTVQGLGRLDPVSGEIRSFRARDGLPASAISFHGLLARRAGGLVAGTERGLAVFDQAILEANQAAPRVVLSGFELFGEPAPIGVPGQAEPPGFFLRGTPWSLDAMTLGHRESVVGFQLSALHFADPQRNRLAYRLDGFDAGWRQTEAARRVATYTNLPGGDYRLEVRASNLDGVWSAPTTVLQLKVLPPPWKSRPAYLAYLLAVVAAGYAFVAAQRRKTERERRINHELRRADRLKDEFLANTSHELRTPLHGIMGLAESLADGATGKLPAATEQSLGLIAGSAQRLSLLVDEILDFAKLRNQALELHRRPVDLHAAVTVALTMLRHLGEDRRPGPRLINLVDPGLVPVHADEDRLQQILLNLIGNGVKFTAEGEVSIEADQLGSWVSVRVRDTGIGIAPESLGRIFESFEQADGSIARRYGGTGLGLALSRQLVALHGGTIEVASELGVGSVFTFSLPAAADGDRASLVSDAAPAPAVPAIAPAAPDPEAGAEEPAPGDPAAGRFTVMVVDDQAINRLVVRNHLGLRGYRVVEAKDGHEALERIAVSPPDLVLLDIMMPGLSGYEVCQQLRSTHAVQDLPVVYLTARSDVRDLMVAFETGANDFLRKPVSKVELLARVRTHLELLDIHRNLELKVAERTQQLRQANSELEKLAALDGLTRIPNRRLFDTTLKRRWREHQAGGSWLAVILCDVDFFKKYNDHYGHLAGDETLIAVATAIHGGLRRRQDVAARYGGEEFVVLLPDAGLSAARELAERIRQAVFALGREHAHSEVSDRVTLSLGVAAMVPAPDDQPSDLVARADQALYRAKAEGRNRVVVAAE